MMILSAICVNIGRMNTQQFFEQGEWWRRDGAFRLLHDINPLRLQLTATAAGGDLRAQKLLDLGCGGGIFCEAAARAGALVCGCDIAEGAIATAKAHAKQSDLAVDYRCGGVDLQESGRYDVLTCFEMLEHVDDSAIVVADAAAMLAPGGVAVFSTINRTWRAWALMIAGLEHTLDILPVGTHDYQKFIRPGELAKMCKDCDLSVRRVVGMRYSFFGRTYLLSEEEAAVNYFLVAARTK